ncbi:MAG: hypothetical protein AB1635_16675 [Acidobacteriota bacterium]
MRALFLLAYTASGLAGLVYQVSWTRVLTLVVGHTTAAASTVVAAFLGGLAAGAAAGGVVASRLAPRRALQAYAALELFVVAAAALLPFALPALTPVLEWAYRDGAPGRLFGGVRVAATLALVFVPAAALGATFPMAIRWYADLSARSARASGILYALNTVGAAAGAVLAGFFLIPSIGVSGTLGVAMALSGLAAIAAWAITLRADAGVPPLVTARPTNDVERRGTGARTRGAAADPPQAAPRWTAAVVLALTGVLSLAYEIAWTRVVALLVGPTTYGFATAVAAVISGAAAGAGGGAWILGRTRRPAAWLVGALAAGAILTAWTASLAGGPIPLAVAAQVAGASDGFGTLVLQGVLVSAALILPTAALLGAAFPLGLAIVHDPTRPAAGRFGLVYALNTAGAVAGALAAGFVLIPAVGLQGTLRLVAGGLIVAGLIVVVFGRLSARGQTAALSGLALASLLAAASPLWDRRLVASGGYLYARFVPPGLDLGAMLRAGELLYYREGATATVSVKRLTGTTTLAVDGKTDASNRGDMLTQKLIAHLPLLLHERPRQVGIIGLGSGATLGAALWHPVARVDVVEISREVVEASDFFLRENIAALEDVRTTLIVGDGRSHLRLTRRQYDVIISEPSNPWIAGVAALFTQEFFESARARLAPGGLMAQWANAYAISDADLRSIVATFRSVFPHATVWLVGESDVVLIGSDAPLDARLGNLERHWSRPGVGEDLASLGVGEPFTLLSLFVAGPRELETYVAGAPLLTDDRMALEFSAPRELHRQAGDAPATAGLTALGGPGGGAALVREARRAAGADQWAGVARMLAKADAHPLAYDAFVRALTLDPDHADAMDGLVREAVLLGRAADGLSWLTSLAGVRPPSAARLVARSKLLAAIGDRPAAIAAAEDAVRLAPREPGPREQLADLHAEAGNAAALEAAVEGLRAVAPEGAAAAYYGAVAAFLRQDPAAALRLAEAAVRADAGYGPVYDLMGAALVRLGDPAGAETAFRRSLSLDSRDSVAYTNLGQLRLAAGDRAAAASLFAEALWLDPDSRLAREGLANAR